MWGCRRLLVKKSVRVGPSNVFTAPHVVGHVSCVVCCKVGCVAKWGVLLYGNSATLHSITRLQLGFLGDRPRVTEIRERWRVGGVVKSSRLAVGKLRATEGACAVLAYVVNPGHSIKERTKLWVRLQQTRSTQPQVEFQHVEQVPAGHI